MGSRKKKQQNKFESLKINFRAWYVALSPHDKIAFKGFFWHYGRGRITLKDLFSYPYFWQLGPLARKNAIADGYTWIY